MLLDLVPDPHHSTFIGCVRPALRASGQDWSTEQLEGLLGHAFLFSMNADGGGVWQAGNYEWSYVFGMLKHFGMGGVDGSLKGAHPVTPEEFAKLKRVAWDQVRASIDQGVLAVGWQLMSVADRDAGRNAFLWGLIVGYDTVAEQYVVRHRDAGEYTVRWDAIGHTDPVNWLSVLICKRPEKPFDGRAAHRTALENAVAISEGQRPGADAAAHGLAAWQMWFDAFRSGKVHRAEVGKHARFLIGARSAAARYLRSITPSFSPAGREALLAAATSYEEVVQAVRQLASICTGAAPDLGQASELLEQAIDREKSALNHIRVALAAS